MLSSALVESLPGSSPPASHVSVESHDMLWICCGYLEPSCHNHVIISCGYLEALIIDYHRDYHRLSQIIIDYHRYHRLSEIIIDYQRLSQIIIDSKPASGLILVNFRRQIGPYAEVVFKRPDLAGLPRGRKAVRLGWEMSVSGAYKIY